MFVLVLVLGVVVVATLMTMLTGLRSINATAARIAVSVEALLEAERQRP